MPMIQMFFRIFATVLPTKSYQCRQHAVEPVDGGYGPALQEEINSPFLTSGSVIGIVPLTQSSMTMTSAECRGKAIDHNDDHADTDRLPYWMRVQLRLQLLPDEVLRLITFQSSLGRRALCAPWSFLTVAASAIAASSAPAQ